MKTLIKVERARHNLSQEDLAQIIKVSRQTIYAIETGKFVPSTVLALKIALFFKVKVEDIFILEDTD